MKVLSLKEIRYEIIGVDDLALNAGSKTYLR